jgi:serine/threonine-protein kinase
MTWLSDETVERLRAVANWPELPSGRYAVMEEIGRGGMGSVYAAMDTELGREVAIKVSNSVDAPDFERRLSAESRVLARLEHPGIVPVHDVGRLVDGRLFYVMKRVHGRTLTEYLGDDSDLGDRLRIFERVCEAVAFAHARRILHRDLKPDNVMIGSFGEVMVMDWGVAKALDDVRQLDVAAEAPVVTPPETETGHGAVLGTPGFMAPEQARGDLVAINEQTDVYGLGGILLALLARNPESIPRPLRSICRRALAGNQQERYLTAVELGEDIARFRAGEAVRAHRENAFERTVRIARHYQTPIILVLTYIVVRVFIALTAGW